MHFGPILRALMHHKARFLLITMEVALTLAIVVNCVNVLLDLRSLYVRDSGVDEESILAIRTLPITKDFESEDYVEEVQRADLEHLRAVPGIVGAAATHAIPLSGSGSTTGRKPLGSEMDGQAAPYFVVSDGIEDALDLDIVAGRRFELSDWEYEMDEDGNAVNRNVILSQSLADVLFPDGDALGQVIESSGGEVTNSIVGIARRIPNSWPSWREGRERALLFPGRPGSERSMIYLARVEPEALESVLESVEDVMLAANSGRLITVETINEIKREDFTSQIAVVKMISAVIVLLILVTSLGIVGLTSFTVAQRTRQIGTRRALGATRSDILRYFLVENWIITGIGLVIGLGLAFGLNYALVSFADAPKIPVGLLLSGVALLWGTGVLAALAPAWRATRVAPEIATRTV